MKLKTIRQTVELEATPQEIYDIFMDAEKHSDVTGSEVEMDPKLEGAFSIFEGYCQGYNEVLDPGKKIVQKWQFAEDGWPEEHFSTCTFEFIEEDGKTKLEFTQEGVPEHVYEALLTGWNNFYWEPLREYLEVENG